MYPQQYSLCGSIAEDLNHAALLQDGGPSRKQWRLEVDIAARQKGTEANVGMHRPPVSNIHS